jgi:hypothetical protein
VCEQSQLLKAKVFPLSGEISMKSYFTQRQQAHNVSGLRAGKWLGQSLLAKRCVNPQFVDNMLLTEEAGFTRDIIMNFHSVIHVWADDKPHTTVASRHYH